MKKRPLVFLFAFLASIFVSISLTSTVAQEQLAVEPTVEPAVEPTVEPTVEPAVEPTVEPTVEPAVEPTVEPTVEPAVESVETKLQKLQELLKAKKWEEADDYSYKLMLEIAGEQSQKAGRFIEQEWKQFDCAKLEEIDGMWSEASNGKFGFRAQREVFEDVNQNALSYYDAIGWKQENTNLWLVLWEYRNGQVNYTKKPEFNKRLSELPKGYLPGKLEWTDTSDHRFDMIYACPGLAN